jgi:hypothetical protein
MRMMGQVHADHGSAEEHHPHVELEEAHPALPEGGVLLVVGKVIPTARTFWRWPRSPAR